MRALSIFVGFPIALGAVERERCACWAAAGTVELGPAGTGVGVRVRATRGQTDMRGLVTAGRAVRLERPLV
jgi:hypothetical protein